MSYDHLSIDTIRAALSHIPSDDRDTWIRIGAAIKDELGDSGFDIWDEWSQLAASYNKRAALDAWKSLKPGHITIGTLIYEAKKYGFKSDVKQISDAEIEERKKARAESRLKIDNEEKEKQAKIAERANTIWDQAIPATDDHPYLKLKGIKAPASVRCGTYPRWIDGEIHNIENCLLIPIRDQDRNIVSLQAIFPEYNAGLDRDRDYIPGGKKQDCYSAIGTITDTIVICEGLSTACSINEATGYAVAIAMDAGNLPNVAKIIRKRFPDKKIIIAADNDKKNKKNAGLKFAAMAAAQCSGDLRVPQFKDESSNPTDFNDLHRLEGLQAVSDQINGIQAQAEEKKISFFRVLGYNNSSYFFYQCEKKQIVKIESSGFSINALIELAPEEYWLTYYSNKTGINKTKATDDLMRDCHRAGIYDPSKTRGRGAWMDNGRTVYHFGSVLWVDGILMDVDEIKSRYVYPAAISLGEPHAEIMSDSDGKMLLDISKEFRWNKPASSAMLLGWLALAPVCGALGWRPHVWITGGAGSGKSTILSSYVHILMGGLNKFALGNSTEAGIRQTLKADALPVLIDESEQNNDREESRMQNIISLMRQSSSETGAVTYKGTASGESLSYIIRSMFMLSSVQVGINHQADFERITILSLRSIKEDSNTQNQSQQWERLKTMLRALANDTDLPARMFMRSLTLLPVTLKNIATFSRIASERFNSVRTGDQYGTLMAGCWSMISDREASDQDASDMFNSFDWEEYRENTDTDESEKFTSCLLQSRIRLGISEVLISELMGAVIYKKSIEATDINAAMADDVLQRHGIRVVAPDIFIAATHRGLQSLFDKTPYKSGIRDQLHRIPGTQKHHTQRFTQQPIKCVKIPLESIFDDYTPF